MTNKVAVITGGSRGIGAAITKRLAKDGFHVVFNYNSAKDAAEKVARECESLGVSALTMQANVQKREDCKALVEKAINEFGRIDVLVNNAGIDGTPAPIWEAEEDEMDAVITTNVRSVMNMTKYATSYMVQAGKGGSIVNISSMVASYGSPGMSAYGASKAAVEGFTRCIAKELAAANINANAIGPGAVKTDMVAALPKEVTDGLLQTVKFNRFAKPEEIAAAVAYFVSEEGRYATGQTLVIDGSTNL